MAEVIKTILTADSSELAAEFAKAAAIAQKYATDREAQSTRALASARAEVEALRLEAAGHGAASAALREKMQLIEQARRLSTQAGITEENATRILARQLELKKQMVTASAAAAAAERRASRIAAPGRNGVALPELALNTASLQTMEKASARAGALQTHLGRLGAAGAKGQNGMMQLAYAVDDAQYGMKGLSNNIPAIVQAFGGGGGLAGGIGIAAVALFTYWKLARIVFKADEVDAYNESVVKGAEAWAAAWKNARAELAKTRAEQQRQRDMTEYIEQGNQSLAERVSLQDQILMGMEREKQLRSEFAQNQDDLRAAREAVIAASGGKADPAAARAEELRRLAVELKAAEEESMRAQQQSLRLNEAKTALAANFAAGIEAREQQIDALRSDLTGSEANIAGLEAQLAAIKESDITSRSQVRRSLDSAKNHKEKIESQIKDLEALNEADKTVRDTQAATAKSNIEQMDAQAKAAYQLTESLKRRIPVLEEINRLRKQAEAIAAKREAAEKAKQAAEKQAPIDAARADAAAELEILRARAAGENDHAGSLRAAANLEREILAIMREQNLTREEAAKQARERREMERNKSRGDFMAELKALKMEARGDKKGADRLREETRIRAEAAALAERLGITESEAAARLREKARLEKEIADHRKNGGGDEEHRRIRGRIYKKTAEEPRLTRENMGEGFTGLRRHELTRRSTERVARAARPGDDAAKNLLKSVNIQEEMLKIWQKLGVV